jgi:hypothetical protein
MIGGKQKIDSDKDSFRRIAKKKRSPPDQAEGVWLFLKEGMQSRLLAFEPSDFNFCKDVWSVILQFIPPLQLAKFRAVSRLLHRLVTTETHKQCVLLNDEFTIAQMIDFAYRGCIVSHVTYQRREYYPCDTFWCERPSWLTRSRP